MAVRFACWMLCIYIFFSMCGHGNGVREVAKQDWKELPSYVQENKQVKERDIKENILLLPQSSDVEMLRGMVHGNHMHAYPSTHMDHMDAIKKGFFTMNDLYVGKIMPFLFPIRDPSSSPHFLPREEADSIPFSLSDLQSLLQLFSISQGSPEAKAMKNTLTECELEPIKGETKFCANSLESLLDLVSGVFGLGTNFKVFTTAHPTLSANILQNYTVWEVPKEIPTSRMVGCHTMSYPYAVFYCHSQESEIKVFKVSLVSENGERVEAATACHMDTSAWSPNHISFRLLGIKPGTTPVCHFFPAHHLVWVQSPTTI